MPPPFLTPERLATLPPEFRDLLMAVVDYYEVRLAQLEAQLATARSTPANSSLPPSTQHPHAKPASTKTRSGKPRGGQPGHPKTDRTLRPTEDCDSVVSLAPPACRRCQQVLTGTEPIPSVTRSGNCRKSDRT